jgi:hypothetical protein
VYTRSVELKLLPRVSRITGPLNGAVHSYQSDAFAT